MLQGSEKINVIPSQVTVDLDVRILPGFTPANVLAELPTTLKAGVDFEVVRYDAGPAEPDFGLFDTLSDILQQADPGSQPIAYLMPGTTDGRFFANRGIQTYGFLPMLLPAGFNFNRTIHAADERIPVDAVYTALSRFGEAA